MYGSVKALLAGIIDYAGLFPPARLPLEEAFRRYLGHRHGRHGWLLACFVCPASRLSDLMSVLAALPEDEPAVPLAILGRGGETAESFRDAAAADLESAGRFLELARGRARIDQVELRLPEVAAADVARAVTDTLRLTGTLGETPPTAFYEASLLGGRSERLSATVRAVSGARREGAPAGFKIRCGGPDAAAVPAVEAVAAALAACREADLPLKATQGLHYPLRHFDPALQTPVHGFVNLFLAGLLAHRHDLDSERLVAIIADQDESAFAFSEREATWRELAVDVAAITSGRQRVVTTFGSCSFSEPRDHLCGMGLLAG